MKGRLKTLLVGAGQIAYGYAADPRQLATFEYPTHASVLATHGAFEWDAVADIDGAAAARVGERYGVRAWTTPDEIPDAKSYECVVLAVPPAARLQWLKALPGLRAVMVEKPLGMTLTEAEDFVALCSGRGITAQVNLLRRFSSDLQRLSRTMAEEIGAPQAATLIYGNGLRNNGTHMVDLVRMLLGEVTRVVALSNARPSPGPLRGDVELSFALEIENGLTVCGSPVSFGAYRENSLDIWGSKGRVILWQETLEITRVPLVPNRAITGIGELAIDAAATSRSDLGRALWAAYEDLAQAVATGDQVRSPPTSALATAHVVEKIAAAGATL